MTGREAGAELVPLPNSPTVILVRPQLAENIGSVARAMGNGGLFHLRLVAPRDGWPQVRAFRTASGADRILEAAQVFPDVASAIADLTFVLGTCPRPRRVVTPVFTAKGAAVTLREKEALGEKTGLLFGPERSGLSAEDLALTAGLIRYPLNPDFMSLNLAQAVMIMAYEWWSAEEATPPAYLMTNGSPTATAGETEFFMQRLIAELDDCGFLRNLEKREGIIRNLRHFFARSQATGQEIRTLHGVVTELAHNRKERSLQRQKQAVSEEAALFSAKPCLPQSVAGGEGECSG